MPAPPTVMPGAFTLVADNWPAVIEPVLVSVPKTSIRPETASFPLTCKVTVPPTPPIAPSELSINAFRSLPIVASAKVILMNASEPIVPPGVPCMLLRISKLGVALGSKRPARRKSDSRAVANESVGAVIDLHIHGIRRQTGADRGSNVAARLDPAAIRIVNHQVQRPGISRREGRLDASAKYFRLCR